MKTVNAVAFVLLVIGGLNWLLVGAFNYDLVAGLLGAGSVLAKVVYILVGISAILTIFAKKSSKTAQSM